MSKTKIEWATNTWNPVTGCSPVSEGCANCYAARMAKRLAGRKGYLAEDPFRPVSIHFDRLKNCPNPRTPSIIFVCSMGDLFHEHVSSEIVATILGIIEDHPLHTFIILTKRPENMKRFFDNCKKSPGGWITHNGTDPKHAYDGSGIIVSHDKWPLPNIWLGVTAENQRTADERIQVLLQIRAEIRFISIEPMLGPINLHPWICKYGDIRRPEQKYANICRPSGLIDWVICGGETGPGARPMHPEWVRSLRYQCIESAVPFFFKQWGEWTTEYPEGLSISHREMKYIDNLVFYRVGKKHAGDRIDGKKLHQFPLNQSNHRRQIDEQSQE